MKNAVSTESFTASQAPGASFTASQAPGASFTASQAPGASFTAPSRDPTPSPHPPHTSMNLTPRQARIKALQEELRTLLDEEAQDACKNLEALKKECQTLLKQGRKSEAVMLYRSKTGLTLKESYQVVNSLP